MARAGKAAAASARIAARGMGLAQDAKRCEHGMHMYRNKTVYQAQHMHPKSTLASPCQPILAYDVKRWYHTHAEQVNEERRAV